MAEKQTLEALGLTFVKDLCPLNRTPPPLSFSRDLHLPEPPQVPASTLYKPEDGRLQTYWQDYHSREPRP